MKYLGVILGAFGATLSMSAAYAEPVEYVRVCDAFGVGYYYIPGTETCVRPTEGQTRQETEFGVRSSYTDLAKRLHRAEADVAISTSLEDPDLIAGESFGLRVNWGGAGGQSAVGATGSAVVTDSLFGEKGRVTASGGVGFTNGRAAGRAGMQLTW